jgi:ketosteroid isomerase-like protein
MEPHPAIHEVDEDKKITAIVLFDAEDLDAACAELDRRFEAGEGGSRAETLRLFQEAVASGEWDALLARCAPDLSDHDHRRVAVFGTTHGATAWIENFRELLRLAPDTRARFEHARVAPRGALWQLRFLGEREGSAYEMPMVGTAELDDEGRIVRVDSYDPEQLEQARARFEEILGRADAAAFFENAASRSNLKVSRSWAARDWEGVLAALSPALRFEDRRRMLRCEGGYDEFVAQYRLLFDQPGSRWTEPLLATRGERLSLHRVLFEAEAPEGGGPLAFEEHLALLEVDTDGLQIGVVIFDLEEEDAAYAELDRRYSAGEGGPGAAVFSAWVDALDRRDWQAFRRILHPGIVDEDNRKFSVRGPMHGAAASAQSTQALFDLSSDLKLRVLHVRGGDGTFLCQHDWRGTRDGAALRFSLVGTIEVDAAGRMVRTSFYDLEQLPEALARFAKLDAPVAGAGLAENAAAHALQQGAAAIAARDWARFESLISPEFLHFDRTKLAQLETERDAWLAAFRRFIEMTTRPPRYEILATRGERLAFARMLWEGAGGDIGPSEIEWHLIVEVDERGDHIAVANFDADDLDAAFAELATRFRAGEGAVHPVAAGWIARFPEAVARRDWDALTAMSAPDLVARNHCMVSWGVLGSRDAWLPAIRSMIELAPDMRLRIDHVRTSLRGVLFSLTWQGTREGGAFEIPLLAVVELDAEGRQVAIDLFDTDKLDRAQARFAEIDFPVAEDPFHNVASRGWRDGVIAAWSARDLPRYRAAHEKLRAYRDHRRLFQLDLDHDQFLEFTEPLLETASRASIELVATRGERLALYRHTQEMVGEGGGETAIDSLMLIETDEHGASLVYDRFDPDAVDEAIAALDARAWPDDRDPTGRFSRDIPGAIPDRDWDAMKLAFAPDLVGRDHRLVGWGTLHGPSAYVEAVRQMVTLAPDVRLRVLHTRSSPRGSLSHNVWLGTREGGAFESPFLLVIEFDTEGRAAAVDLYDPEQIDRALSRFDEIAATVHVARFSNQATRWSERFAGDWAARDWPGIEALQAPDCRGVDHRRLLQLQLSPENSLDQLRVLFDVPGSRWWFTTLATRGERLALTRTVFEGQVDEAGGALSIEGLQVCEIDAEGRLAEMETFDSDDLDTAYDELDARFESDDETGGATWQRDFRDTLRRRDYDAMAALYAPDVVGHDHRLVSWGTLHGPTAMVETARQIFALAPDARLRCDHLRTHERGAILEGRWVGTRDGGAFENHYVTVLELGPDRRALRLDFYDPHRLEEALAQFAEIAARPPAGPEPSLVKPTIATKATDRFLAASRQGIETGDMEPVRSLVSPDFAIEDRTRTAQLSGDRELMIESLRFRAASGARPTQNLFGTAGELVAIAHALWAGGPEDGRFEVEYYAVVEVDETGVWTGCVLVDDPRAAEREAWRRWARIEPESAELTSYLGSAFDAFDARDRTALRANFADDLVVEDHRRTGMGRIEGADGYVESLAALWELAPEAKVSAGRRWLAYAKGVGLTDFRFTGQLSEGGDFENLYLSLFQVRDGRAVRLELFELDAAGEALQRFETLRAEPSPARVSNLATQALDRWWEGLDHGAQTDDWGPLRAAGAPDLVFEDRQPFSQLAGGLELAIESIRTRVSQGANIERTLKGTLGERIAVVRVLWRGGPADARFEIEYFPVVEAEASGLLSAIILCDGARSAQREAWARWAKHEPELAAVAVPLGRLADAFNAHDRAAWRAELAEDVVVQDHRLVSMGRLEGADAWSDSVVALWELAPESTVESGWEWIAIDERGALTSILRTGTLPEGGEFESEYLLSYTVSGGKIDHVETFETHAREEALAHFHARRTGPDPLVVPENAASRALAEVGARRARGGVVEVSALVSDDFEFEDRGRRSLVQGGVDEWLGSLEYLAVEADALPEGRLVATGGDRLSLHQITWRNAGEGSRYEWGGYRILELDEAGKIRAFLLFDDDDRAGAHAELLERWSRQPNAPADPMSDYLRSWSAHDGAALRELLVDDFVFHDERRTGIGRVDAEGLIRSLEVLWQLSSDVRLDVLYALGQRPDGVLSMAYWWGTDAEGGAFETFFASIAEIEDGRLRALRLFEPEDLEAARARYEELGREAELTTAVRIMYSIGESWESGALAADDFAQIRAGVHPDFRYEDRGKKALVSGDVETWIESMRFWPPGTRANVDVFATIGDRIALDRASWVGDDHGTAFEIERIRLTEFDAEGRLLAAVHFDPEDRTAATLEALTRFAAGEAAGSHAVAAVVETCRAIVEGNWPALSECLHPDLVFIDHRPLRLGTLDRESFVDAQKALLELDPNTTFEVLQILTWSDHCSLGLMRRRGRFPDGGGPFEITMLCLLASAGDRIRHFELFAETDTEPALARFRELSGEAG